MAIHHNLVLTSLAVVVFYYVFTLISHRQRRKGAKIPPGPKGLPILGNALQVAESKGFLVPMFNQWAAEHGPIVQFDVLGQKQVVLSSEKACHDLFVSRSAIYSGRGATPALEVISKNMNPALMPKNELWRKERRLIHRGMSIATNASYQPFMAAESTRTLHDLLTSPEKFDDHLARYSYGVLARSLLGFDIDSIDHPFVRMQEWISNEALNCFRPDKYIANLVPALIRLPRWLVPSNGRLADILRRNQAHMDGMQADLEAELRAGTARDSIHRYYLEHRDEFALGDEAAQMTFGSMIGGGTRSPHVALLTWLTLMMEHPEWLRKLQDEVDAVTSTTTTTTTMMTTTTDGRGEQQQLRLPDFDDIPQLPTVRAVVKEGIRYRSIVAEIGIPHRLDQDDVYEGYFFEKGTIFHANYSAIVRDKALYPDDDAFNPSRWLDPAFPTYREPLTAHPNLQGFTSFGYGRRACPGYDFAERTLVIMVARLAWACDIRKPVDRDTGEPVVLDVKYEPTPNPRPLPFPCEITPRDARRAELVAKLAKEL